MSSGRIFKRAAFMRWTITIPGELEAFVEEQRNSPQHAGNLSSYIRSLIIAQKAEIATPVVVRVKEVLA